MGLLSRTSSLIPSKSAIKANVANRLNALETKRIETATQQDEARSQLESPSDTFNEAEAAEADSDYRSWTARHPKLASYGVGLAATAAMGATVALAGGLMAAGAGVLAPATLGMLKMAGVYGSFLGLASGWVAKEKTQTIFKKRALFLKNQPTKEPPKTEHLPKAEAPKKSWLDRATQGIKNSTFGKIFGKQALKNAAFLGASVGAMELGLALGLGTAAIAAPLFIGGALAVGVGGSLGTALSTITGAVKESTER